MDVWEIFMPTSLNETAPSRYVTLMPSFHSDVATFLVSNMYRHMGKSKFVASEGLRGFTYREVPIERWDDAGDSRKSVGSTVGDPWLSKQCT